MLIQDLGPDAISQTRYRDTPSDFSTRSCVLRRSPRLPSNNRIPIRSKSRRVGEEKGPYLKK